MSASFAEIEAAFSRAAATKDTEALRQLDNELQFRVKNQAAAPLRLRVQQALQKAQTVPPASSRAKVQESSKAVAGRAATASSRPTAKPTLHRPTPEQQEAIDAFRSGRSLKINAYAGTGKTSTLQMLAQNTNLRGQYIAFNRSIVTDARTKFPSTVNCATAHSLAFHAAPAKYKQQKDKLTGKISASELAETLDLKYCRFGGNHGLQPRSQAFLFQETIKKFAQSADAVISAAHVPQLGLLRTTPEAVVEEVRRFAVQGATRVWTQMLDERSPLPIGFDGFLKLWALSEPRFNTDYILLDEAQDTNPVVLDVLRKQPAQMIYVGDKYQQIYEWRGAVNAMETIATDATAYLTTSFRFGPAIASVASDILLQLGERRPITGNSRVASQLCQVATGTVLGRTNASTISAVIEALDIGRKPHLVGGTDEMMKLLKGVQAIKDGHPLEDVPEFFGFSNWPEVVAFAKSEEGAHLLTFVNLVEARGEKQLMWALNRTVEPDKADLMVSTAHKSKGCEWPSIRLMDDFMRTQPNKPNAAPANGGPDPAELRLLYVAMTRAKERLDVPTSVLAAAHGRPAAQSPRPSPAAAPPPRPAPAATQQPVPSRPTAPRPDTAPAQKVQPPAETIRRYPSAYLPEPDPTPPPAAKPKRTGFLKWLMGG